MLNRVTYSLLLFVLSPLLLIYLTLRGRKNPAYRQRWAERFALARLKPSDIWLHAVSMGETQAAAPLIKQLLHEFPKSTMTLTASSPTGSQQIHQLFAAEIAAGQIQHVYLPFDLAWCARRFIKQVQPQFVFIMETELWPNLLHYAQQQGARLMLLNGRLSAKSLRQYQQYPKLIQPMLQLFSEFAVQTADEKQRFIELGVTPEKLHVCGNVKFDLQLPEDLKAIGQVQRQQWQRQHAPVWVAASLHPPEFEMVLQAHQQLLAEQPQALLILVPRHPEQFEAAFTAIQQSGLQVVRRSQHLDPQHAQPFSCHTQVFLGDSMGEMLRWYACADQALIGGSLFEHGGHNPLEAAALGLPTLMGQHYRDFLEINQQLQQAGNLIEVSDASSIYHALSQRFAHPELAQKAAQAGQQVVKANQGAQAQQWALMRELLLITQE